MTSKLTREQLHERARENVKALKMASRQTAFESAREEILADLQLAELALAAMDGEPVADVLSNRPGNDTATIDRALPVGTQLYRHAQQSVVPDGYVMVPAEPNGDMLAAAQDAYGETDGDIASTLRAAMLAAAPQSPGSEPATVPGKWIPVSERMPENDVSVLTFDGMYKRVHHAMYGHWQCWEPEKITHWMPLPAAPQEVR